MNRKRIILFSLCIIFYSVSSGQLVPSIAYSGKNFSVEDGLSQPRITDIYSDKQGFLWIGTEDGLNRYDGYQFEKYRHFPGDSTSIGNNYIHCISEDPNGNIWVGTGQGLSFKKKNSTGFQNIQFHREDSIRLINQAIQEIYLADSNILWLKSDSYFEKYNIETGKILSYRFSTDYENYSIQKKAAPVLRDKYGNFWFGSHRGLYSFDEDKCEFTSYNNIPEHPLFLNNNAILSLKEDPDGKLWIGTEKGLYSLDDDRVQFKKYLESAIMLRVQQ